MQTFQVRVINDVGLHARPAATFIQIASRFKSKMKMKNLTNARGYVDAKSILGVLTLGVERDHEIELIVEGEDENQASAILKKLIEDDFIECP